MSEVELVESLSDHFVQLPNAVFRDPELRSRAIHVLGNIASHRAGFKISAQSIANSTGLSKRTVLAALQDLIECGYVERFTIPGDDGKFPSYRYRVRLSPVQKVTSMPGAESEPGRGAKNAPGPGAKNAPLKNTNENTNENTPLNPPEGEKQRRGSRLTDEWQPSQRVTDDLRTKFPNVDFQVELEKFKDYWIAKPGRNAVKLDWDRTWRSWVRNASQWGSSARSSPQSNDLSAWLGASQGAAQFVQSERVRELG